MSNLNGYQPTKSTYAMKDNPPIGGSKVQPKPPEEVIITHMYNESVPPINASGRLRHFPGGARRDAADGKPRMELLPDDLLEEVATWYGLGAEKYGENNWRKGQPDSAVIGSLKRHLSLYMQGNTREDHLSAIIFNALVLMNNRKHHANNPMIRDIKDWFEDGKPTGNPSYLQKQPEE